MDTIARESCACVEKMQDTEMTDTYVAQLGVCMIVASEPYKEQLKEDHDIDFSEIDKEGERLGRIIGVKMLSVCPDVMLALTKKMNDYKAGKNKQVNEQVVSGKVAKIETDQFLVLHIKDNTGKTTKFYWLEFVKSDFDTGKINGLPGKKVEVTFTDVELFDPQIKEYRKFSVIRELDVK
jgi:hypothetical protein